VHPCSYHATATRGNIILGYVIGKTYRTSPLLFGNKSYANDVEGDTFLVNEICVIKSEQNQGIASKLLETIINSQLKRNLITNLEFTLHTSNLSSEKLFTAFAERNGTQIQFNAASWSMWGNYLDWNVSLLNQHDEKTEKLLIVNSFYNSLPFNYSMSKPVHGDRMDVINRAIVRQESR
jgi:GNAT superfamily N-acetyltransferase